VPSNVVVETKMCWNPWRPGLRQDPAVEAYDDSRDVMRPHKMSDTVYRSASLVLIRQFMVICCLRFVDFRRRRRPMVSEWRTWKDGRQTSSGAPKDVLWARPGPPCRVKVDQPSSTAVPRVISTTRRRSSERWTK